LLTLREPDSSFADAELESRWDKLIALRDQALKVLETMRQAGTIGAPLEAKLEIGSATAGNHAWLDTLRGDREALKALFIVSDVAILPEDESDRLRATVDGQEDFRIDGRFGRISSQPPVIVMGGRAPGKKCQRCWMYFEGEGDLDPRCRAVVQG
jgi:isoleucyl-tRNA synthetase